jgi:hypothetical protein
VHRYNYILNTSSELGEPPQSTSSNHCPPWGHKPQFEKSSVNKIMIINYGDILDLCQPLIMTLTLTNVIIKGTYWISTLAIYKF